MKEFFKNNLRLLIPKYGGGNDLVTRRIMIFAVLIPFVFGGLALWFSYTKVIYSEKKYAEMFAKLNSVREQYNSMKTQLDSSKAFISEYQLKLSDIAGEYDNARIRLRDSIQKKELNIRSLQEIYLNAQQNYFTMQDSAQLQKQLLTERLNLIETASKRLAHLNDSISWLVTSLQVSNDSLQDAMADVEMMKSSIESMAGEAAKIKPQARSRTLFGKKDSHEKQLYEYAIWLNIPKALRKNISAVTYKFNIPTDDPLTSKQSVTITDASNDFKTSYTGSGCAKNMIIQVRFKSNFSTPIYFDLCSALN